MVVPVITHAKCTSCFRAVKVSKDFGSSNLDGMHGALYSGKCQNGTCSSFNRMIFACSYCLHPSSPKNAHARKHPGVFTSWKACVSHSKSNSHKKAVTDWEVMNSTDTVDQDTTACSFEFGDMDADLEDGDTNLANSNNGHESYTSLKEKIGQLGFDPDSKSPDFFCLSTNSQDVGPPISLPKPSHCLSMK